MPTKKRRVGFIPRSDVLDLINKLSFESNLSISKIINILVEEALYKRGIFNLNKGKVLSNEKKINIDTLNPIKLQKGNHDFSNELSHSINIEYQDTKDTNDEFIDKEIYDKFLMFLQFQEKMKKRNQHD